MKLALLSFKKSFMLEREINLARIERQLLITAIWQQWASFREAQGYEWNPGKRSMIIDKKKAAELNL